MEKETLNLHNKNNSFVSLFLSGEIWNFLLRRRLVSHASSFADEYFCRRVASQSWPSELNLPSQEWRFYYILSLAHFWVWHALITCRTSPSGNRTRMRQNRYFLLSFICSLSRIAFVLNMDSRSTNSDLRTKIIKPLVKSYFSRSVFISQQNFSWKLFVFDVKQIEILMKFETPIPRIAMHS